MSDSLINSFLRSNLCFTSNLPLPNQNSPRLKEEASKCQEISCVVYIKHTPKIVSRISETPCIIIKWQSPASANTGRLCIINKTNLIRVQALYDENIAKILSSLMKLVLLTNYMSLKERIANTTTDMIHNPKNLYLSSKYKQQVLARLVQQCQRRSTRRYK